MHGKCEIGGNSMMAQGPCHVGVHKRCKVMSRLTIEESGDDTTWVPPPAPKFFGKAELPLEKALVGIMKEMKESRKSVEKIA